MDGQPKEDLIVIDVETTGFPHQSWAQVIEVAAVILRPDGSCRTSWHALVRPTVLDERADPALAVNGFSREELMERGRDPKEVAQSLMTFVREENRYCTSFNSAFDQAMLDRMGCKLPWSGVCVMKLAREGMEDHGIFTRRLWTNLDGTVTEAGWPRLKDAVAFYGVHASGPLHRALTDALATARIHQQIVRHRQWQSADPARRRGMRLREVRRMAAVYLDVAKVAESAGCSTDTVLAVERGDESVTGKLLHVYLRMGFRPTVLVTGGRNYAKPEEVRRVLGWLRPARVIHGGAIGADTLAEQVARNMGIPTTVYPANWKTHGKAAGSIRNQQMLQREGDIDYVAAFPGGNGTNHMVEISRKARIPVGLFDVQVPG